MRPSLRIRHLSFQNPSFSAIADFDANKLCPSHNAISGALTVTLASMRPESFCESSRTTVIKTLTLVNAFETSPGRSLESRVNSACNTSADRARFESGRLLEECLGSLHDGFMGAIVIVMVSREEMLTEFETRGENRQDATVMR